MLGQVGHETLLKRVDGLEREIERLKRDMIRNLALEPQTKRHKPSLFGTVQGGDITLEMVEESKQALFRPLEDL